MNKEDADLIDHLGGPAKLAKRLRYNPKQGGIQRVQNWKARGIPASVERDNQFIAKERRALRKQQPLSEFATQPKTQELAQPSTPAQEVGSD